MHKIGQTRTRAKPLGTLRLVRVLLINSQLRDEVIAAFGRHTRSYRYQGISHEHNKTEKEAQLGQTKKDSWGRNAIEGGEEEADDWGSQATYKRLVRAWFVFPLISNAQF